MPKAAAMADFSGPSLDCVGHRDMYAARLPGIALSTRSTGARQMAPKPLATAFAIDILRSEEQTSELQSLIRISYAVFCLKKKTPKTNIVLFKTTFCELSLT